MRENFPSLTRRRWRAAAAAATALLASSGCFRTLDVADVHPPTQPDVTWGYAAVRSETRLFTDYSAVDARFLTDEASSAEPAAASPPSAQPPEPASP